APPSYVKDVQPFLKKYCVECHRTGNAKSGINLESYDAVIKGGRSGRKMVVANDPDNSRLVTCTEGTAGTKMPPRKAKNQPTKGEVEVLRNGIKAGARADTAVQEKKDSPQGNPTSRAREEAVLVEARLFPLPDGRGSFSRLR